MQYKALMLDVDGTTVLNQPKILPTQNVRDSIAKAQMHMHVGLATSRTYFHAAPVIESLQLRGPSILDGGAMIIDVKNMRTLKEHLISRDELQTVLKIFKSHDVDPFIQEPFKDYEQHTHNFSAEKVTQIFAQEISIELADPMIIEVKKIPTLSIHKMPGYLPGKVWVSVTSLKATKQHGILEVAQILGIDTKEIIGVGDGYNDFPLLMACGLKIAMGNAVDELKEIADYIAPSVEEDGVAHVINKFIIA